MTRSVPKVETLPKKGRGRPKNPFPVVVLTVRTDPMTLDAIDKIVASMPQGIASGSRSLAIRKAVLDMAARLDAGK